METSLATSDDENLPGIPFLGHTAWNFPESVAETWHLRWLASTASTNDDLVALGQVSQLDRVVLVADHQTAGRGRLDRVWEAPQGMNLLVSFLFRRVPRFPHALTHAVAMAAAQASVDVVATAGGKVDVDIKWPNDLLVGGAKLGGILSVAGPLAMTTTQVGENYLAPTFVVVGLGLNVGWAPEGAAALAIQGGVAVDRDAVLGALVIALDRILVLSDEQLYEDYRANLSTLGKYVRIELPNGEFVEGDAVNVDVDGRLVVLDTAGVTQRFDVGDIIHLR